MDEHAAVWVPDSEAGTCMHCKKVIPCFSSSFSLMKFNFSGSIHIGKSTPSLQKVWSCLLQCLQFKEVKMEICWFNLFLSRFLLPAQSSKPLRVCMTCFDELSSQSVDHSFNKGMLQSHESSEKGEMNH